MESRHAQRVSLSLQGRSRWGWGAEGKEEGEEEKRMVIGREKRVKGGGEGSLLEGWV